MSGLDEDSELHVAGRADGHPDQDLLVRYARGEVDQSGSMALEIHLVRCAACRGRLRQLDDPERLERGRQAVLDAIHAPRRGYLETLLIKLGVGERTARLVAATPSLRASWFAALVMVLGFAVVAATRSNGILVLLVVAPLLPVTGVAAAYGPGGDPAYEIGLAAPLSSFRLLLLRAAAVLAATTVLAGLAGVASTVVAGPGGMALLGLSWAAVAWLLPALGLTLASMALSTVTTPVRAARIVGMAWLVAVVVSSSVSAGDGVVLFRQAGQIVFAALAACAGLIVVRRREAFDRRGTA